MRIALSGAHAVGKSTLITELHRELPTCAVVDEPFDPRIPETLIATQPVVGTRSALGGYWPLVV